MSISAFVLALGCLWLARAPALESALVVDGEGPRPWSDLESSEGLRTVKGWRGLPDLVLRDASYRVDESTELLVHFDFAPPGDSSGHYLVSDPGDAGLATTVTAFGDGSGAFEDGSPTVFEPAPRGGSRGLLGVGDFTIEFWFYPLHLGDGETIISWTADRAEQGGIRSQSLSCRIHGRVLEWRLGGLFLSGASIAMTGLTPLVPGHWAHHMLRYDSSYGLLEYLVDGVPEAVTYATSTGHDGGSILPLVGDTGGRISLGDRLTGLLDEMRVEHSFVERPTLARYSLQAATAVTRALDLGRPGSRVLRIEVKEDVPGASAIELAYRVSDDPTFSGNEPWMPFVAGEPLPRQSRGRFVQVRAELLSDGKVTPSLSRLRVVYEPNLPPPPPARVVASAGDGSITLSWQRVFSSDVAGYLVYYGLESGSYYGEGSSSGASPVDAGDTASFTLAGLTNGRLYYLAVVAYDRTSPPQQSRFSSEVTARPSAAAPAPAPTPKPTPGPTPAKPSTTASAALLAEIAR